jgi:phosphomethylpyrimidine synthase
MGQKSAVSSQKSAVGSEQQSDNIELPASRKIYIESVSGPHVSKGSSGSDHDISLRVPFREIALSPSKEMDGTLSENPPVRVYDTSGLWTDPDMKCSVRDGLPALRRMDRCPR